MVLIFTFSFFAEMITIVQLRDSSIVDFVPANIRFVFCIITPFVLSGLYFFQQKNADYTFGTTPVPIRYLFDEKGVRMIDEKGTSFTKWNAITNAYDCLDSISLVINAAVFVIPKRNFKDGEQLKNTRNLIKKNVARFSYAKGNRKTVSFENTYENTMSSPGVQLIGPEAAKVVLKCWYSGAELSEFLWRYVTRFRYVFRCVAYFCIYNVLIHFYFWNAFEISTEYEWLAPAITGLCCFGFYYLRKSQRFKTVQACYDGRLRAVIEIGNDRILFKTKALKTSILWSEIIEMHETGRYFILKTNYELLIVIPKISLNSEYKQMFVCNLLRRKKESISKAKNVKAP